jgi:hypothetical protein
MYTFRQKSTIVLTTILAATSACDPPHPPQEASLPSPYTVPRTIASLVAECDNPETEDAAAECGLGEEMLGILGTLLERRAAGYPGGPTSVEEAFEASLTARGVPEQTLEDMQVKFASKAVAAVPHGGPRPVSVEELDVFLSPTSRAILSTPDERAEAGLELRAGAKYRLSIVAVRSERCANDWGAEKGCDTEEVSVQWTAHGPGWSVFDNTDEKKLKGIKDPKKDPYPEAWFTTGNLVPRSDKFSYNPLTFVWRVRENDPGGDMNWLNVGLAAVDAVVAAFGKNWVGLAKATVKLIAEIAKVGNADDFYPMMFSMYNPADLAYYTSGKDTQPVAIEFFSLPLVARFAGGTYFNNYVTGGWRVLTLVSKE